MEKLKKKRAAKRSRFSLVANTLRRMIGENNNNSITSMFLESLKKNLDDLQRLDRAIQELLVVEDEKVVVGDREKSEIYRRIYEQLCAQHRKRSKKRDSELKSDKSASEKFQELSELRLDTTPESTLPPNVFPQPAGDISECSPDSSKEPTPPSPGNVLSPANKFWDQLVNQIEAMEKSLSPDLVCDLTPDMSDACHMHRHTIMSHMRTISLTRLLVALADDVSPERLPERDWRRVQRALAAPPLGADRVYVIKNSFLLQRPLRALWATLHAVRRNDVERCSAARAGDTAAQRLERWRAAHRDYCAGEARVSLLLLQRRWHELRLLARAWARAGAGPGPDTGGEGVRLLRELCRTFPHLVQEEPQRWQELRRAGELDLDLYDSHGYSEYSDEEDGNLVIDEGPMEARAGLDAGVGVGGVSSSDEGDDIDKLHQIDPAQAKTTLIFDSDVEMDVKDVDTSPGAAAAAELQEKICSDALRPTPRVRDRLVFEEDDAVDGSGACVGDVTNSEVKTEPSAVTSEGEVGGRVGSGGAAVAASTRVAMDSKLLMEPRVPLVRVEEMPAWGERARGETPRLGGPRGRRGARGAVLKDPSSRREGSSRGKYAGKCEQLLSVCRPVSVLLERLPLDAGGGAAGGCGPGSVCAGGAGGERCGRVVLPQLAQVLARRRRLLTAQVAPLVRDHGTTPPPGGESGELADDRSSALWHAFDLDAEKSYEPEEMLVRTRSPALRGARWLRPRGAELLRRLHGQLLAYLQRHRLLPGEGVACGAEAGGGPLPLGENVKDKIKKKASKKKKIPPPTRGQGPADPGRWAAAPGRGKRNKKEEVKVKVNPAPEAKHPPKDEMSEYERWLEERNRGSLMYGFKPREVKTRQSRDPTEPARKKTLLNSHETVANDTDKTVKGSGGGKIVDGDGGGKKRGFLRVVPLASLQGPSPGAGVQEKARIEAVVDLCDESGWEEEATPAPRPPLEGSLIHRSRLVVQPIVSHFNVFLESVAPHHQSPATQIPIGQILLSQDPVPQSSLPQNPVPQSSILQNPVRQSSISQNPVPQSSILKNSVPQSSIYQNPVRQSSISQNPVPQSSIPQNPVPQSSILQNPVRQSSISQNPVRQSSIPQNPVPQSSIPQNPVPQSSILKNSVPQSSIHQNPVPQSSLLQNPVRQSAISQNPVPQSSIPQNPVPQSSIPQNPVPQSSILQNPVRQSSISQNPVRQSSIPQNPVPQSSIPQNPVPQSSILKNSVPQSSIHQNPVPQSSILQNPVRQSAISQNPVPQSSIPQNPVPQSSIPQNPVPQSSILQNPVRQSSISQNPVPQSSIPQNPLPQSSILQNPVRQSSISQNPVPQSSIHQNPVPQSSILQNPVRQSSISQNPVPKSSILMNSVPQSSIHQNPVRQSSISQNPVPLSRKSQNRNVVNVLIPRRVVLAPAARPPTSQGHRDQAPQPQASAANSPKVQAPALVYSSLVTHVAHSSNDQSAKNQTYIYQGHPAHIPVTQAPAARYRKPEPPQYRHNRPIAPRPLPETTLSTPTPLVTGNSTTFGSQPPVVGTAPPAAQPPVVGTAPPAAQPPVVGTAPPAAQPPWARSGKPNNATSQPPWLRPGGAWVLPLTERNLSLHNRIFSKSSNN